MNQSKAIDSSISIVSATYNCIDYLPKLIESLRSQTDKNFEWVVADGDSTDGTLELLNSISDIKIVLISQPDFGIYDGLNRAIKHASAKYYIVAGADDFFANHAVANYRSAIELSGADVVVANVKYGTHYFKVKRGPSWLFGEKSFIANHSLGTAFNKELHNRFGFYSKNFPIAADSLFVIRTCRAGVARYESNFVAGEIGTDGISATDWAGSATEIFRVQIIEGGSVTIQTMIMLLRIIKGASSVVKTLYRTFFRDTVL